MSSRVWNIALSLLSFYLFLSCQNPVNPEQEKEKIRTQMTLIAEAHFTKDATQFYASYSDSWYDAREGQLRKVKKTDVLPGTQEYLDQMEFVGMDNTHEPLVEISDDGKMASYMGAILLRGRLNGNPVFWIVSWQSVLKKIDEEWQIISNANTQAAAGAGAELILEKAKEHMGLLNEESTIYAMADCDSPGGAFKTLLISSKTAARMEQQFGAQHSILKYGQDTSWTYDINAAKLNDELDELTEMFIQGHELHWLSFRPEDRFNRPSYKGFEEFNGVTSFKIEFKDELNRPVYCYYAFENYQPLGFNIATNRKDQRVNVFYSDWQEEGGLKVFYKATFEDGPNIFEYEFSEIKIGTDADYDLENKNSYMKSTD